MRHFAAFLILLALSTPATAIERTTLNMGVTQFPSTFHPGIDSMMAKQVALAMVHRPFTVLDPDGKLVCRLCETVPTLENGLAELITLEDGRKAIAVTISIREGAFWGDGTPVTSDDVIFSWEVGKHPQTGYVTAKTYREIISMEALDERTVRFVSTPATFQFNYLWSFHILPEHLERAVFEEDPLTYRNRTLYDTDRLNPGLYNGPYRVSEVSEGAYVVLSRSDAWQGQRPHFDQIVVRAVPNTAAMEASLRSGAIDMVAGELGMTLDQALAFQKRQTGRYKIIMAPSTIYELLVPNLKVPALQDVRVRRAILHAIDRETISSQLFEGWQPVAHSNVHPMNWYVTENVRKYAYDPARAAALLEEAGWHAQPKGPRRNADGEALRLVLMTTAGNRSRSLVQQVIAEQLQEVGFAIAIRNQQARVFFGNTVDKRQFDGLAMFAWISFPEQPPRTTLHSEYIPTKDNSWSGQNYAGYSSPAMDATLDALREELDSAKREELWHTTQRIFAEDLPILPLFFKVNPFVLPNWLENVRPTGSLIPSQMWVEEWTVSAP